MGAVAINKIPNVAVTLREGTRTLDPAFSEMATVYRFPFRPQTAPRDPAAAAAVFRHRRRGRGSR